MVGKEVENNLQLARNVKIDLLTKDVTGYSKLEFGVETKDVTNKDIFDGEWLGSEWV